MKTRWLICSVVSITLVVIVWFISTSTSSPPANGRLYNGRSLDAWFAQYQGYSTDPVTATFREIGPAAVTFLTAKSRTPNSWPKQLYIKIWPKLPSGLKTKQPPVNPVEIRRRAVKALRNLGPGFTTSPEALAVLCERANDSGKEVRSIAAGVLGDIGPGADSAVPALIASLKKNGTPINAVWALGRIGPKAAAAVPVLLKLTNRESGRLLVYAAEALKRIDPKNQEAVPFLCRGLSDANAQARAEAAKALESLGEEAKPAVPHLVAALHDSDKWSRQHAAMALAKISPEISFVTNVLAEALNDLQSSPWPGLMAAEALLKVAPKSSDAGSFLTRMLANPDQDARLYAASLLLKSGLESEEALSSLAAGLSSAAPLRRLNAAIALANTSLAGKAVSALQELSNSQDARIREAALTALRDIRNNTRSNKP